MTVRPERRFAGVLAHHDGHVILVRESHKRWGGEFWNVPGGMVETHEKPAEGAARELAEETGLVVLPDTLLLRTTSSVMIDGHHSYAWNFEVQVDDPTVRVQDPDLLVQEARWFTVDQAVARLRLLPYRPIAEPAIATLSTNMAGTTHWAFAHPEADPREPPRVGPTRREFNVRICRDQYGSNPRHTAACRAPISVLSCRIADVGESPQTRGVSGPSVSSSHVGVPSEAPGSGRHVGATDVPRRGLRRH